MIGVQAKIVGMTEGGISMTIDPNKDHETGIEIGIKRKIGGMKMKDVIEMMAIGEIEEEMMTPIAIAVEINREIKEDKEAEATSIEIGMTEIGIDIDTKNQKRIRISKKGNKYKGLE